MKTKTNTLRQALVPNGQPIRCGLATIPWCDYLAGWVLPNGPRQQNRVVKSSIQAHMFAERMHEALARQAAKASRKF